MNQTNQLNPPLACIGHVERDAEVQVQPQHQRLKGMLKKTEKTNKTNKPNKQTNKQTNKTNNQNNQINQTNG